MFFVRYILKVEFFVVWLGGEKKRLNFARRNSTESKKTLPNKFGLSRPHQVYKIEMSYMPGRT